MEASRREATQGDPEPYVGKHKEEREPKDKKDWKGLVSMGGPHGRRERADVPGGAAWTWGDIDFRDDGAIFIRNPYLADAIEAHLKRNHERIEAKDPKVKYLLRIVRDEGWSGWETNVVC